jgi:hypothetical protein
MAVALLLLLELDLCLDKLAFSASHIGLVTRVMVSSQGEALMAHEMKTRKLNNKEQ